MSDKNNLFDDIKNVGATLGSVASEFAGRLREERSNAATADEATLLQRLRTAAAGARDRFNESKGTDGVKAAATDFATEAESIVRDLVDALGAAAGGTKDSEAYAQASTLISDTLDNARTKAQNLGPKKTGDDAADGEKDGDATSRLEDLMTRLRGDAKEDVKTQPDIIDGEVISVDPDTGDSK
ncbi:CGLAU_01105 family protein [Corynebacterium uterequi]|uniref:Uncharacterized protein n=1 Tax=Corynebacterium uterequi TaxID=1072256 RepID=A0A0G3HGJ6_9CORY|nr:CGLAU_01105 family protein [Corynebacterium uterequi]AKK10247.1 hypothetical protein CUTER_01135 [Corynebacterium uterequi]